MRSVAAYKGIHSGPVVLLANGGSLLDHDLSKITYPVIGLNHSWSLYPNPKYHLALDYGHYRLDPDVYQGLDKKLFVMGERWPVGCRIKFHPSAHWSWDLEEGATVGWQTVGSVVYVGLQLAVYMGFNPIYILGLDLKGEHFHNRWPVSETLPKQNLLYRMAAKELAGKVEVFNVSPHSECDAFPKIAEVPCLIG